MTTMPAARPRVPHFSSGPCAKRPGWKLENLKNALLGRSHRSKPGKARLKRAIDLTREVLGRLKQPSTGSSAAEAATRLADAILQQRSRDER